MTENTRQANDADYRYDVFISYASEEREWVRDHVFRPLRQCRRQDGRPPKIFFDVSREGGIDAGQQFVEALTEALHSSRHIVPVFSELYLRKDFCDWELSQAFRLDPAARRHLLVPILMDASVTPPASLALVHSVGPGKTDDWFERLCKGLDLIPGSEEVSLTFLAQPRGARVNLTLEPIEVAFKLANGNTFEVAQDVFISGKNCGLQGTLRVQACKGVATFSDLSCGEPCSDVRLEVVADGLDSLSSEPFDVYEVTATNEFAGKQDLLAAPIIPVHGQPIFFENGVAVAMVGKNSVDIFNREGKQLSSSSLKLRGPIRSCTRFDDQLVMLDWLGNVHLLFSTGQAVSWSLNEQGQGFVVPGGVTAVEDSVLVGFWSGHVFRMSLTAPPTIEFIHSPGVQTIAAIEDRIFIGDLEGNLVTYHDLRRKNTVQIERGLHLLKACQDDLISVGETNLYLIETDPIKITVDDSSYGRIASCLGETQLPVIVDADGKGCRLGKQLITSGTFHTVAGATPTSADDGGRYTVFMNPDGTQTVLEQQNTGTGRIVYTHSEGGLAVAPPR